MADNHNVNITELEAEVSRLKVELEKSRARERDLDETRKAMLSMLEDINESQGKLETSKREWEETFDAISDPIFIHDKEFRIVKANRAYQEAVGMSFQEIIGKPYYEVFPKMDSPLKTCHNAHESREEEVSVPSMDKIFKSRFYSIKDVNGKSLYFIHILEDITERKRAEERYKAIIQTAMDGFWVTDTQGRILDVNDAYCKLTGYSRDEMLTMSISDVETAETPEVTAQHTQRIIRTGCDRFESRHRCKNSRIINVEVSVNYMEVGGGRFFVFIRDITGRKRAEERLKEESEITRNLLMIASATAHVTDMNQLVDRIVNCVWKIVKCDMSLFYLWDHETKAFKAGSACGLTHEMIPLFRTEPLDDKVEFVRKALEEEKPIVVETPRRGVSTPQHEPPGADRSTGVYPHKPFVCNKEADHKGSALRWIKDMQTMSIIPLIGKKEHLGLIIGVYQCRGVLQYAPTEKDMKVMEGISHQVSTAIEETRLYRESIDRAMDLSHKIETIQVMHEIDRSILSTLEIQDILETVMLMISRVIPSDRVTVSMVDRERCGIVYKAGFGIKLSKGHFIPLSDTAIAEVVRTKRPQFTPDLSLEREPLPLERVLLGEGYRSHMRIPMVVDGEVVGVLNVGSKGIAVFTPEHLATMEKLASQTAVALKNARLVADLREMFLGTVKALSVAMDAKSPWTAGHSERVTKYALAIGKEIGLDEKGLRDLEIAGLLHDIGKVGTYEAVLDKPEKLTDEETKIMRQHPGKGAEILSPIKQFKDIIPSVKYHHEFYNGGGYPDGLKGEDLPLMARTCVWLIVWMQWAQTGRTERENQ